MFLLLFSSFLTCCSNDDTEDFRFDAESLKQTTWEGTKLLTEGDQVISTANVVIQFYTINSGQCIIKQEEEEQQQAEVWDFKYSIEDKLMEIENGALWGTWFLLEMEKDKLVLEKRGSYIVTLTLYKKY